jgi:hypothetical protein
MDALVSKWRLEAQQVAAILSTAEFKYDIRSRLRFHLYRALRELTKRDIWRTACITRSLNRALLVCKQCIRMAAMSKKKASTKRSNSKNSAKGDSVTAGLGMIGGAAAGAATGALLGPVSAAVGAIAGGVAGANAKAIGKRLPKAAPSGKAILKYAKQTTGSTMSMASGKKAKGAAKKKASTAPAKRRSAKKKSK